MDPASAVIGIVSFGFTVLGKVNEVRKVIKGAPQSIKALQDSCTVVQLLLEKLKSVETHKIPRSPAENAYLGVLRDNAHKCLQEVEAAVEMVVVRSADGDGSGQPKLRLRKFLLKRSNFNIFSQKVKELQGALDRMLDFTQSSYLQYIVGTISETHGNTAQAVASDRTEDTASGVPYEPNGTLHCLHNCGCRCHDSAVESMIPARLASYLGQMFLSKRLFCPPWSTWSRCNVQTCRGDLRRALAFVWLLPHGLFSGCFLSTGNRLFRLSIGAQRVIPYSAPIAQAVIKADLHAVRTLFSHGQASIYDTLVDGWPMFTYACRRWQRNPSEKHSNIVQFFVDAGAADLLHAESDAVYSAHDWLVIGIFNHLLSNANKSLATLVRTSPAAINMLRAFFDVDPMDALEDFLSRKKGDQFDVPGLLSFLETTECDAESRTHVFRCIGYSPLGYAIRFSPQSVFSLLESGEDATREPTVAWAVATGNHWLIRPLIEAGGDVNMRHSNGSTALHYAALNCKYDSLRELLQGAEHEVNWNARTPEGKNALELFEMGVSRGLGQTWGFSATQMDDFRSILESHVSRNVSGTCDGDADEFSFIPGSFPRTTS